MEIKVQKQVRLKANILGLKTDFFYIFMGVSVLMVFFIIFNITILRLLTVIILSVLLYFLLLLFQRIDFGALTKLPDTLINK
jgi:predicted membrane channel-forming protein YqfA (hemolysin III family)